jgi:hypothetical protein
VRPHYFPCIALEITSDKYRVPTITAFHAISAWVFLPMHRKIQGFLWEKNNARRRGGRRYQEEEELLSNCGWYWRSHQGRRYGNTAAFELLTYLDHLVLGLLGCCRASIFLCLSHVLFKLHAIE